VVAEPGCCERWRAAGRRWWRQRPVIEVRVGGFEWGFITVVVEEVGGGGG
jgi:hypothetical protein